MNVLIAGASTFAVENLGDDAMLAALVQAIECAQPGSDIRLLARHPSPEFDEYFRLKTLQNLEHDSNAAASGRMFVGFNKGDSHQILASTFHAIEQADVLVLAGNLLMEISGNTHLRGVSSYASLLTVLAQVAGTPTAVFGLNVVEPMKSNTTREQARHVLGAASAISVREEAALQHLASAGIDCSSAVIGGDPAIGLVPEIAQTSAARDRIAPGNPRVVSLCIRNEYWSASETPSLSAGSKAAFENLLGTGAVVRFVPNCTYTSGHPMEDDRLHHRVLFGEYSGAVDFIEERMGLHQTVELLSESDIHLTNRRHSAILAGHAGALPVPINTSLSTHMSGFLAELSLERLFASSIESALRLATEISDDQAREAISTSRLRMTEAASATRRNSIAFVEQLAQKVQKGAPS